MGMSMTPSHGSPKIVPITRKSPKRPSQPSRVITQERLREGSQLIEESHRILELVQKFKMDIDADLAAGAEVEAGELMFDAELKIVRPRKTARVPQVLAR
jgi:hypothetical protein